MKPSAVVVLAATLLVAAWFGFRAVTAQQERSAQTAPRTKWSVTPTAPRQVSARSRVVNYESGRPLAERLDANDEELEVVDFSSVPFFAGGDEDPLKELEFHTRRADAVVVGSVIESRPQLTAAQDWINSTIDFQIEEVLKNTEGKPSLAKGQVLSFDLYGGEMSIDGKRVLARPRWSDIPRRNRRYLYFLFWDRDQYRPFSNRQQFQLTVDSLKRLELDANWGIEKGSLRPQVAFDMIRLAAMLPPLQ